MEFPCGCLRNKQELDINFETTDGRILNWERGLAIIEMNEGNTLSPFLHLDAWSYNTTFRFDGSGFYETMSPNQDPSPSFRGGEYTHPGRLRLTGDFDFMTEELKSRLHTELHKCIMLVRGYDTNLDCLVVGWNGETAYRIGMLPVDSYNFDESRLVKRRIRLG